MKDFVRPELDDKSNNFSYLKKKDTWVFSKSDLSSIVLYCRVLYRIFKEVFDRFEQKERSLRGKSRGAWIRKNGSFRAVFKTAVIVFIFSISVPSKSFGEGESSGGSGTASSGAADVPFQSALPGGGVQPNPFGQGFPQPNVNFNSCNVGRPPCDPSLGDGSPDKSLSCSAVNNPADALQIAQRKKASNNTILQGLQCKSAIHGATNAAITCLKNQTDQLDIYLRKLSGLYEQNLQKFEKEVEGLNKLAKVRHEQFQEIGYRLNGDPRKGGEGGKSPGLIQLEKDLAQYLFGGAGGGGQSPVGKEGLNVRTNKYKETYEMVEQAKDNLKKAEEISIAARAKECFKTQTRGGMTCGQAKGSVSAYDHLLCFYQEKYHNNSRNRNDTDKELAKAERAKLQGTLDQLLSELPDATEIPGEIEGLATYTGQKYDYTDPDKLIKRYGNQLKDHERYAVTRGSKRRSSGVDVDGFVRANLQYCYKIAKREVRKQSRNSGSNLNKVQLKVKQEDRKLKTVLTNDLEYMNDLWTNTARVLTGLHLPGEVRACTKKQPQAQIGCIENFGNQIKGLYNGNTNGSTVHPVVEGRVVTLRGQQVPTIIQGTCDGVKGCLNWYQGLSTKVDKDIRDITQANSDYIKEANRQVENVTTQISNQILGQAKGLENKVTLINSMLAQIGGDSMDVKALKPEEFQESRKACVKNLPHPGQAQGDECLYETPKDMRKLIGGKAGLLDLDAESFSSAFKGLGKAQKEIGKQRKAVADANADLDEKAQACAEKEQEDKIDDAQDILEKLEANGCAYHQNVCDHPADNDSSLEELGSTTEDILDAINEIAGGGSGSSGSFDSFDSGELRSLDNGIRDFCLDADAGAGSYGELLEAKSGMEQAQDAMDLASLGGEGGTIDREAYVAAQRDYRKWSKIYNDLSGDIGEHAASSRQCQAMYSDLMNAYRRAGGTPPSSSSSGGNSDRAN